MIWSPLGCKLTKHTNSWPFSMHFIILKMLSLPPLIRATNFIPSGSQRIILILYFFSYGQFWVNQSFNLESEWITLNFYDKNTMIINQTKWPLWSSLLMKVELSIKVWVIWLNTVEKAKETIIFWKYNQIGLLSTFLRSLLAVYKSFL
jgi:hypothetical protein